MRSTIRYAMAFLGITAVTLGPVSARDDGYNLPVVYLGKMGHPARTENVITQTNLGYMYETGVGTPQNYQLAATWYHRAAQQGFARAQYFLGMLYDKGKGVPLDYVEAHKWLILAAARATTGDRDYFVRIRNAIGSKLSTLERYEAQRRASEWVAMLER
jgi:uncharacterized protein